MADLIDLLLILAAPAGAGYAASWLYDLARSRWPDAAWLHDAALARPLNWLAAIALGLAAAHLAAALGGPPADAAQAALLAAAASQARHWALTQLPVGQ